MKFGRIAASPPGQTLKGTTRLMKSARSMTGLAMAAVSVLSLGLAPMAFAQDTALVATAATAFGLLVVGVPFPVIIAVAALVG